MAITPRLFEPISFRSVTARNRIVVSPMCQYCAHDGLGDDWHLQHLGARAMGGAGIVFTEATHVSAVGRITPGCLGLYSAEHQAILTRVAALIERGGAVPGVADRSCRTKGEQRGAVARRQRIPVEDGGWVPLGPQRNPFGDGHTDAPRLEHGRNRRNRRPVRRDHADGARGWVQDSRTSRRARLPRPLIPLAALKHAQRQLRRRPRRAVAPAVRTGRRRARANGRTSCRCSCGSRRSDWMQGGLTIDDTVEIARRLARDRQGRSDRLLVGRRDGAGTAHTLAAPRLPGAVRRSGQAPRGHCDRSRRMISVAGARRRDRRKRSCRPGIRCACGARRSGMATRCGQILQSRPGSAPSICTGSHRIGPQKARRSNRTGLRAFGPDQLRGDT